MRTNLNSVGGYQSTSFGTLNRQELNGLSQNAKKVMSQVVVDPNFKKMSTWFDVDLVSNRKGIKNKLNNSVKCDIHSGDFNMGSFDFSLGFGIKKKNISKIKDDFIARLNKFKVDIINKASES